MSTNIAPSYVRSLSEAPRPFRSNITEASPQLRAGLIRRVLGDAYVPSGFKGYGVKTRAIKGHPFGLHLSARDKTALIAFLKTL
jgi:hypothetical protein